MIAQRVSKRTGDKRAQQERARRELARRRMLDFTRYTFPEYKVNWHHALLCRALDMLLHREIQILFVFMSPQHGKSELVSRRFPAMVMGQYPNARIMLASYASKLATEMAGDTKRIMRSDEYKALFPDTKIGDVDQADRFNLDGFRGKYLCGGILGGLTGFGYDFGILDDLLKNAEEARSEVIREKIKEELQKTFLTRRSPIFRLLVTATRWHEDDGPGWLMEFLNSAGIKFHVLVFQAEKTNGEGVIHELSQMENATLLFQDEDPRERGEFIWESFYGREHYELEKQSTSWTAMHQQSPTAEDGNIFNRSWFRYYHRDGDSIELDGRWINPANEIRFGTVDLAFSEETSADYCAIASWCFNGTDLVLLDMVRDRFDPDEMMDMVVSKCKQHKLGRCFVEDVGAQLGVVRQLEKRAPVVRINPKREKKEARAWNEATRFKQGKVWFPATAPWLADLEHELLTFPNGKHDDMVDTVVYAVREMFGGSQGIKVVESTPQKRLGVFDVGATGRSGVFG